MFQVLAVSLAGCVLTTFFVAFFIALRSSPSGPGPQARRAPEKGGSGLLTRRFEMVCNPGMLANAIFPCQREEWDAAGVHWPGVESRRQAKGLGLCPQGAPGSRGGGDRRLLPLPYRSRRSY